jgi:hypothetical protein
MPDKNIAVLQSYKMNATFLYDCLTSHTVRLNEACGDIFLTRSVIQKQPLA